MIHKTDPTERILKTMIHKTDPKSPFKSRAAEIASKKKVGYWHESGPRLMADVYKINKINVY